MKGNSKLGERLDRLIRLHQAGIPSLLDRHMVSTLLGVSPRTLLRMERAGGFPDPVWYSHGRGRGWKRWRSHDVFKFLEGLH